MLIAESPIKLGNLFVNEAKVFHVDVNNSADTTIVVTEIFVGCQSCTTVAMPKRIIPPNDVVKASVTFTPKTLGVHNKTISIRYKLNDEVKTLVVNFTANVEK